MNPRWRNPGPPPAVNCGGLRRVAQTRTSGAARGQRTENHVGPTLRAQKPALQEHGGNFRLGRPEREAREPRPAQGIRSQALGWGGAASGGSTGARGVCDASNSSGAKLSISVCYTNKTLLTSRPLGEDKRDGNLGRVSSRRPKILGCRRTPRSALP